MGAATLVKSRTSMPTTTGSPHTFANKQAAVVQDLARRQTSCPAHPANQCPASFGASAQRETAANLESTFARPSFEPAKNLVPQILPSIDCNEELAAAIQHTVQANGSWANFCVKHDVTCARSAHTLPRHKGTPANLQARRSQLQNAFSDMNIAAAIAKDPLLLTYSVTTLQQHMDLLQTLVGKDKASAMVAKMPALLHLKPSTLSCKMDDLYDLLPNADVGKMAVRSPFLLGLSHETLAARMQALSDALPNADVQSMAENYPSLLECKLGKVPGNLHALQQLLPEGLDSSSVVQYMPTLLLSNIRKVEEKYTRMQILCMHRLKWRKDLAAIQGKAATFARLLGVSHSVLDRLSFLLEDPDEPKLAASSVMLMSRAKFEDRFPTFKAWQQQRNAAQHVNLWQSSNALSVLGSLDQDWSSSPSATLNLHDISRN